LTHTLFFSIIFIQFFFSILLVLIIQYRAFYFYSKNLFFFFFFLFLDQRSSLFKPKGEVGIFYFFSLSWFLTILFLKDSLILIGELVPLLKKGYGGLLKVCVFCFSFSSHISLNWFIIRYKILGIYVTWNFCIWL
jgi:hypothetical protein